jgi:hypothetical protein
MTKEKKSYDMPVEIPDEIADSLSRDEIMNIVERAATSIDLYISHIGSYSRKKFPNSVHWHFKRDKKENGLIDATFWDVKSLFWLMIRYSEPAWVHEMAPKLQDAISREIALAAK